MIKTAIFLRGYQRLWHSVKDNTISVLNQIYGNDLDWYVAFWESRTTNINQIQESLSSQKLIFCEVINDTNLFVNPDVLNSYHTLNGTLKQVTRLAYLDQYLNTIKCRHELRSNTRYDEVIFIRGDILYRLPNVKKSFHNSKLNPLWYSTDVYNVNLWHEHAAFEDDVHLRFGQLAADIYANRYLDILEVDPRKGYRDCDAHSVLWMYLAKSGIRKSSTSYGANINLIRPNWDFTMTEKNFPPGYDPHKEWQQMSSLDRVTHCRLKNIDPIEYDIHD